MAWIYLKKNVINFCGHYTKFGLDIEEILTDDKLDMVYVLLNPEDATGPNVYAINSNGDEVWKISKCNGVHDNDNEAVFTGIDFVNNEYIGVNDYTGRHFKLDPKTGFVEFVSASRF